MYLKQIAVAFDFDGTLSDSMLHAHRGVISVCIQSGLKPPTFVEFLRTFHAPYEPCYRKIGVTAPKEDINHWYHEGANHSETNLFPDVPRILQELVSKHCAVIGIVTAQPALNVRALCDKAGISHLVPYLAGGAQFKARPIEQFHQGFAVPPSRTWFVGDLPSDMRDGRMAGVHCVGITRGNPLADLLFESGAERCIEHLEELFEVLDVK